MLPKECSSERLNKGFSECPQTFEFPVALPRPSMSPLNAPVRCHALLPLQLLAAIQLFGANLDDYLHLLLPPIVKLFDAPEVPLPSRK